MYNTMSGIDKWYKENKTEQGTKSVLDWGVRREGDGNRLF